MTHWEPSLLPRGPPGHCHPAMAPAEFLLLAGFLLVSPSWAQRPRNPKLSKNPIDKFSAQERFDTVQFTGKWFLVGVASDCRYLRDNSYRLDATNVVVSLTNGDQQLNPLVFSTFRPLEGICWNIKQTYFAHKVLGRFLLRGRGAPVEVMVRETDYRSYAILYFQKNRKISAKLYGRTSQISDEIMGKFERAVVAIGLNEDHTFYYPVYGFCDSADQFHTLDETKNTG